MQAFNTRQQSLENKSDDHEKRIDILENHIEKYDGAVKMIQNHDIKINNHDKRITIIETTTSEQPSKNVLDITKMLGKLLGWLILIIASLTGAGSLISKVV